MKLSNPWLFGQNNIDMKAKKFTSLVPPTTDLAIGFELNQKWIKESETPILKHWKKSKSIFM